ncbi:hypothetical protein FRC00_006035, partial [Tulasnella sp. 408]
MSKHHPAIGRLCEKCDGKCSWDLLGFILAPYVILTYDQKLLFASVMSAILARMVVVALSVALQ